MGDFTNVLANSLAKGISDFGNYSARAASRANGVSAAAQAAQGAFNQNSANIANNIGADRIAQQYGFNSGQAASANAFTQEMWNTAAAWNEEMFERQMQFNREEAQKNRDWQEYMAKTSYQRAVADMEKAGLNPILAVTGGGISTGSGGGSAASAAAPSMSGATGSMASGGLMNGLSASEGNYTGQMEYMGGILGLLSAGISGLSTAFKEFGSLGEVGEKFLDYFFDYVGLDRNTDYEKTAKDNTYKWARDNIPYVGNYIYKNYHGGSHGTYQPKSKFIEPR